MNLNGKKILVTGAGGIGVGSGICDILSECGAQLIINDICEERIVSAVGKYKNAIPVIADIRQTSGIVSIYKFLQEEVGVIDGLVNNAGVGLSKLAHNASEEEFDNLFAVDIKAVWGMSKFFVQQLIRNNKSGNIVNVSSVHAHATIPRYAIYSSAKSAVEGLTRGMAVELGKYFIRVNAIAPGYVHAEQNIDLIGTWTDDPDEWLKRYIEDEQAIPKFIEPKDCGYAAAFLLSDLSRSITGQTLYIDNGDTIKLLGALAK